MFVRRLKNCITTCMAVFVFLIVLLFVQALQITRFAHLEGKRSFYLKSPSSQALVKECLLPWEFFQVKGESVVFLCEEREKTLAELMERYEATVLFKETAGDSVSYYCFTNQWTDGIEISDVFVNLQVAFNGESCVVGAPIIFGGF